MTRRAILPQIAYVQALFDDYTPRFEQSLVGNNLATFLVGQVEAFDLIAAAACEALGLDILLSRATFLRLDRGEPVDGMIIVAARGNDRQQALRVRSVR
ncbi:hypothetical protein [Nocardia pseudobrasiliensis]|uniref:Uncharacterized protein n=1 Tax=Nocardia pseudobrasiliensis TaxID=45979 RepID=A0A370HRD7_9NOCA|nr:hypothetical protein [Nocardia pseudobrasiliensis]RDI60511.1 hypothetical protein DFR76_115141 [Nocardia pseudobrasiliensis]